MARQKPVAWSMPDTTPNLSSPSNGHTDVARMLHTTSNSALHKIPGQGTRILGHEGMAGVTYDRQYWREVLGEAGPELV